MIVKIIAVIVAIFLVTGAVTSAESGDLESWLVIAGGILVTFVGIFVMGFGKEKTQAADNASEASSDKS